MGEAFRYLGEHFLTVSFPMALGIIILILTLRRWLDKRE